MQIIMLLRPSSRLCHLFACVPLLVMVPLIAWSVINKIHGQYHATMPVFLLAPVALLYLVVVWIISKLFGSTAAC
jgi:hypothetical protein